MHTREEKLQAFGRILDVLDELRAKCPWDRKQTNESLRPQTIEEVYELSDARRHRMRQDSDRCREQERSPRLGSGDDSDEHDRHFRRGQHSS